MEQKDGDYVEAEDVKKFLKEVRLIVSEKLYSNPLYYSNDKENLLRKLDKEIGE